MTRRFDSIRTDRLVMRRWRAADREPYAALNADPEVMPAGVPGAGGTEVGWRLARRAWHQGYAAEAATAAAGVAFDGAGLDRLWSMTAVVNRPSQAVMLRLGMTPQELFDHPALVAGHPLRRHIAYRLERAGGTSPGLARG